MLTSVAQRTTHKALKIDGNLFDGWMAKGKVLFDHLSDENGAFSCFRKAVKLRNDSEEAWRYQGMAQLKLGDSKKAPVIFSCLYFVFIIELMIRLSS